MGTRNDDEDEKVAYESNPKEQYENVFGLGSQWVVKPTITRCKLCNLALIISSISSHIERKHPECLNNKHPDETLVSSYTGEKFKAKNIIIHSGLTDHEGRRKNGGDKQSQGKLKSENKRRISTSDDDYYAEKKKKVKKAKTKSGSSRKSSSKKSSKLKIPKSQEEDEELFTHSDNASMNMEEEITEPIPHTKSLEELVVVYSSHITSIPDENEIPRNLAKSILDLNDLDRRWKNKEESPKHNGFDSLFQKSYLNGSSCRFSNHSPEILPNKSFKYCHGKSKFTNKCRNLYKILCAQNPKFSQSYVSSLLFRNRIRYPKSFTNGNQKKIINPQPSDMTSNQRNLETLNDSLTNDKTVKNEKNLNSTQSNASPGLLPNNKQVTAESVECVKEIKAEAISQSPIEHVSKSLNGTFASSSPSQTDEISKKLAQNTSSSVVSSLQNNVIPLQLKRLQIMPNKSNQVFRIRPPNPLDIPEIVKKSSNLENMTHAVSKSSNTSFKSTLRVPQPSVFDPNPALAKCLINPLAAVSSPRKVKAPLDVTNQGISSLKQDNTNKIANVPFRQNNMIVSGVPIKNNLSKDQKDTTQSENNQSLLIPIHIYDNNNNNSNAGNLKTANHHSPLTPNQYASTWLSNSKSIDGNSRDSSVAVIKRNHQIQPNNVLIQNSKNATINPLQPIGMTSKNAGINSLVHSPKHQQSLASSNDSFMSMISGDSIRKNSPLTDQQKQHQTPVSLVSSYSQMNVNNRPSTTNQSVVRISLSQKDMELLMASRLEVIAHTSADNNSPSNDNNNVQSASQLRYVAAGSNHQNNIIRRPVPSSLLQNISVNQTKSNSQHLMKLIPQSVNSGNNQNFGSNFSQNASPSSSAGTNKDANLIPFYVRTSQASDTRDTSSLIPGSDVTVISFQNIQQKVRPLNPNFMPPRNSQPQISQFSSSSSSSLGNIQPSSMGFSGTNVIASNLSKHSSDPLLNVSRDQGLSKNVMKTLLWHGYPQQQQQQIQMNQKTSTQKQSTALPLFFCQKLQSDQIQPQVVSSLHSNHGSQVSNYRFRNEQFTDISRQFNSNQHAGSAGTSSIRPNNMSVVSAAGNNALNPLQMPFYQNFQRQQMNQRSSPNLNRSSNPEHSQNVIRIRRNLPK